ncbi:MAG TPA: YbbR-like domain-containing protein [Pyrinomonadaceae bacterium]|jgi:YbbR domain-containing protein|nr:YbbR-like domain-containing protein [Pyrinomonadaceae bacterium]
MSNPQNNSTTILVRVETWLRKLFVDDWGLKLLALAITLVLWIFVSARQFEREVAVEPRIEGKPAASFEVKEIVISPNKVKLQGPADRVNAIDRVTLPVSVEGRRESFDARGTALPISDPSVEPLNTVNVHVTIVASGNAPGKTPNVN